MSGRENGVFWPAERLEEALESAAAYAGLLSPLPRARRDGARRSASIESSAARLGIEAEAIATSYGDLEARLLRCAPGIVRVPAMVSIGEPPSVEFAVIVGARRNRLAVLAPDLTLQRIDVQAVTQRLCAPIETPHSSAIERMLENAGVPESRRPSARRAMLRQQLRSKRVEGIVRLRPPPRASFAGELYRAGILWRLTIFLAAHAAQYLLWVLAWWIVGSAALAGRFDPGTFLGWALLLASVIPLRLVATWSQGLFAVEAGGMLKSRLLDAALRLDPQSVRGQGVGSFVGRVLEAEAVESLALSGGTQALTALTELFVAGLVLVLGAENIPLALGLFAWTALAVGCGAWCVRRRSVWTDARLGLTHDLVEKMVGHRTRLAQVTRENRHAGEDAALDDYMLVSRRMDTATAWLLALAPRGWLLIGTLGCGIAIVRAVSSTPLLAVSLGGVLLAYQALTRLAHGLSELGGAAIAWKQLVPLLSTLSEAGAPRAQASSFAGFSAEPPSNSTSNDQPTKVLQAQDLAFTHPGRDQPVIRGLNLDIFEGDRILLDGPSGSGKSTLASLLTGLRVPDAGVLLLRGVDQGTMGEETWRRRVASAPQFHENHVLTETFAFNVLMGRSWPPRAEDVQQAEELCGELGLSDLLARMPAGLFEMVGESGWQLSHGERSRLFMARALLQESEIVVLDESFAALDPGTLEAALRCALDRTKTLVVIAHP